MAFCHNIYITIIKNLITFQVVEDTSFFDYRLYRVQLKLEGVNV